MISSFLLHDIPRHDTRLFEVREAFVGFGAYINSYIAKKTPPAALPGGPPGRTSGAPCGGLARLLHRSAPVAIPETDAGPLINALIHTLGVRYFDTRVGYATLL